MIVTNSMIAEAVVKKLHDDYGFCYDSESIMLDDLDIWRTPDIEDMEISVSSYNDLVDSIVLHYVCVAGQ